MIGSRATAVYGSRPSAGLTAAGFALLATFDHPHFTLVLADLSELTLARLDR